MWIPYNPNPKRRNVDDCSIRALTKVLGVDWNKAYAITSAEGFSQCDMPHSNSVWGKILKASGFERIAVPDTCPDCYSIEEFLLDNPKGKFVIAVQGHVVSAIDGNLFDTWDSSTRVPQYFWYRKE